MNESTREALVSPAPRLKGQRTRGSHNLLRSFTAPHWIGGLREHGSMLLSRPCTASWNWDREHAHTKLSFVYISFTSNDSSSVWLTGGWRLTHLNTDRLDSMTSTLRNDLAGKRNNLATSSIDTVSRLVELGHEDQISPRYELGLELGPWLLLLLGTYPKSKLIPSRAHTSGRSWRLLSNYPLSTMTSLLIIRLIVIINYRLYCQGGVLSQFEVSASLSYHFE